MLRTIQQLGYDFDALYSEPTAFHRALKGWHLGVTLQAFRARHVARVRR